MISDSESAESDDIDCLSIFSDYSEVIIKCCFVTLPVAYLKFQYIDWFLRMNKICLPVILPN